MPVPVRGRTRSRLAVAKVRRFPARTLHLVDIENLAGAAIPSLMQVMEVQDRYARSMSVGVDDLVVMASSHLGLVNTALGWPHARYRVRSGPDGADLALLDVIWHEDVATRFTHIVIGSGDGTFVSAVQALSDRGVLVTVVSRWGSLSPRLANAAHDVVYLDSPAQAALPPGGPKPVPQTPGRPPLERVAPPSLRLVASLPRSGRSGATRGGRQDQSPG